MLLYPDEISSEVQSFNSGFLSPANSVFLREEGCVDSWFLFESKGFSEQDIWGNTAVWTCCINVNCNTVSVLIASDSRKIKLTNSLAVVRYEILGKMYKSHYEKNSAFWRRNYFF